METSRRVSAEPNVTPMIDVMLVLLIIFMAVGPLLAAGVPAEPPPAAHRTAHPEAGGDIVIAIDAAGLTYLDRVLIDSAALREGVRRRLRASQRDRVIFLRADAEADYGQVQAVMQLASGAGARVIGLIAREPAPTRPH